jgi:hypothetical protein
VSVRRRVGLYLREFVATRPALTHLSTMTNYNPGFYPSDPVPLFPPNIVSKFLFCLVKLFEFPPNLNNEFPPNSAPLREWKMAIDVISADRAAAGDRREAARAAAHQYLLSRAEARRDTRVEEAKAAAGARPTPSERAIENPAPLPARLLDILA